ncbi:unnamed protein product [Amoebophrya sp. A25]|nr:unnamed protein product [Amoebophrya sp. A25]|eukprot:GSA25T00007463001.1
MAETVLGLLTVEVPQPGTQVERRLALLDQFCYAHEEEDFRDSEEAYAHFLQETGGEVCAARFLSRSLRQVAWDGTSEAAFALHHSLRLLVDPQRLLAKDREEGGRSSLGKKEPPDAQQWEVFTLLVERLHTLLRRAFVAGDIFFGTKELRLLLNCIYIHLIVARDIGLDVHKELGFAWLRNRTSDDVWQAPPQAEYDDLPSSISSQRSCTSSTNMIDDYLPVFPMIMALLIDAGKFSVPLKKIVLLAHLLLEMGLGRSVDTPEMRRGIGMVEKMQKGGGDVHLEEGAVKSRGEEGEAGGGAGSNLGMGPLMDESLDADVDCAIKETLDSATTSARNSPPKGRPPLLPTPSSDSTSSASAAATYDFQSFSALCAHERKLRDKFPARQFAAASRPIPRAIEEALALLERDKMNFLRHVTLTTTQIAELMNKYPLVYEMWAELQRESMVTDDGRNSNNLDRQINKEPSDSDSLDLVVFCQFFGPRLSDFCIFLLRLLLTSCHYGSAFSAGVDILRETEPDLPEQATGGVQETSDGGLESYRQREIVANGISRILFILLRKMRDQAFGGDAIGEERDRLVQSTDAFTVFSRTVFDSNGILVLLKYLNGEFTTPLEVRHPTLLPFVRHLLRIHTLYLNHQKSRGKRKGSLEEQLVLRLYYDSVFDDGEATSQDETSQEDSETTASSGDEDRSKSPPVTLSLPPMQTSPFRWALVSCACLLECLYLLCVDWPDRVQRVLVHYKAPFILKKIALALPDGYLKMMKLQLRVLSRKWKTQNMPLCSDIYVRLTTPEAGGGEMVKGGVGRGSRYFDQAVLFEELGDDMTNTGAAAADDDIKDSNSSNSESCTKTFSNPKLLGYDEAFRVLTSDTASEDASVEKETEDATTTTTLSATNIIANNKESLARTSSSSSSRYMNSPKPRKPPRRRPVFVPLIEEFLAEAGEDACPTDDEETPAARREQAELHLPLSAVALRSGWKLQRAAKLYYDMLDKGSVLQCETLEKVPFLHPGCMKEEEEKCSSSSSKNINLLATSAASSMGTITMGSKQKEQQENQHEHEMKTTDTSSTPFQQLSPLEKYRFVDAALLSEELDSLALEEEHSYCGYSQMFSLEDLDTTNDESNYMLDLTSTQRRNEEALTGDDWLLV